MRIRGFGAFLLSLTIAMVGISPALGGSVDLNNQPDGLYSPTQLAGDWNSPPWNNGVTQGRASIVSGADAYDGKSLKILYPAGEVGPVGNNPPFSGSGAQWRWELDDTFDEMYFEYKVMFPVSFQFVKGGKLPGLVGGTANTGGSVPNGFDGWSARMMWVGGGNAIQYVYHPDQPDAFGDTMTWNVGGQRQFTPGVWHTIRNRVVMNTPTQNDGIIQGWFDGELALDRQDVRFRDTNAFGIDTLYFSSFYGGADPSWAPSTDQNIFFDNFRVTTALGDFNADLIVDGSDLQNWENGFGISGTAEPDDGDANRDGSVDGNDFLFWQKEFSTSPALLAASVPEPSTGLLAMMVALVSILIGSRRRNSRAASFPAQVSLVLPLLVVALIGAEQASAATVGDGNVENWRDGNTAAVTLTIDDNFQVDHPWWISTSDAYDVRVTWFVISGNVGNGNPAVNGSWGNFAFLEAAGHDIQSHTVDHFPMFPGGGPLTLETNYTQAITDIEANVPGSDVLTLAYPFGLQAPNDKTLAGQHYIAARGVTGTLNTLNGVDYLNVNSLSTNNYGGGFPIPGVAPTSHFAYIPKLLDQAKAEYRGWLSVHSHQLDAPKKTAITGLLDYVTATPGDFWVGTFTDVAQYAQERDDASLVTNVIGPEEIQFTLTDTLDDTRFYAPLTVKVRVDNAWTQVVATQDGQPLDVTLIQDGGEQFALINSVPDAGVVSLTELAPDPTADFDGDGDIDGVDFLSWQRGFGTLSGALPSDGDADFSESVDAADLAVWGSQYGQAAALAATAVVPEPMSSMLMLCGLLALQFFYR